MSEHVPFDFNGSVPLPAAVRGNIATSTPDSITRSTLGESGFDDSAPHPNKAPPIDAPAQSLDTHARVLHPRSCVTCRRRKVKCDKAHPCANCVRAHIECVYPTPGRAPRRPRKPTEGRDVELLERLRRLEGVVKGLGVDVVTGDAQTVHTPTRDGKLHDDQSADNSPGIDGLPRRSADIPGSATTTSTDGVAPNQLENKFGRLVVSEGRSRYVNTSFWASLSNEVEDLKGILNDESDDEDDASPGGHATGHGHHQGWVFGYSSQSVDMLALHPSPTQIETYWSVYQERVDPLVKIIHIPSITPTILSSAAHLTHLSKGFEALLFAIYYGATTSLSPEESLSILGEDRAVLLSRYRFGVEQALARANFLIAEELVILQAFVIFLICLRRNSNARVIWTLTGLLVRMAQTVGIHRDGTHFGLPPFEVEMRRRLWWQVCILDIRASEDHGCDPTIVEQSFDTKLPLNINDADIQPDSKAFPTEQKRCTEMSFCLIRYEVSSTFRRLNYVPPGLRGSGDISTADTRQEKEKWIQACHDRVEEKYLKHCDMTIPLYWVTATVARLIMSKMWLIVYHPYQRQDGGASLPQDIKDKLFITSLENLEYALLLETETRTMKWHWLSKTYMQWHAMAFILTDLTRRTKGPLVERAWIAVEKVRDGRWKDLQDHGRDSRCLWRPLERLYRRAIAARQQALDEEQGRLIRPETTSADASAGQILPGSVLDYMSRQGSRSSMSPINRNTTSGQSSPAPTFGSKMTDTHNLMRSPASASPVESGVSNTQHLNDFIPHTNPQQSYAQTNTALSSPAALTSRSTWPSTGTLDENNTMNTFTNTGQNNFGVTSMPMGGFTQTRDSSMSFDLNEELDWANFDNMVRQFDMDIDTTGGGVISGQADPYMGPTFFNAGNVNNSMSMGSSDWF